MLYVGVLGSSLPTLSYIGYSQDAGNSFSIGTAATDRRLFANVHWGETGSVHRTLLSATIGGVSATIHGQEGHSGGASGFGVAVISAVVPTGTTASVATTFSGAVTNLAYGIHRVDGLVGGSPTDTAVNSSSGTSTSISDSIIVPAAGVLVAAYSASELSNDGVTWTGVTENYDFGGFSYNRSGGALLYPTGSNPQTVGITKGNESNSGNAFFAVSWA